MAISSLKIVEAFFESAIETYEHQTQMMDLVDVFKPGDSGMQNAGNFVWRPVQQNAPIIEGWDLTGLEQDVIEPTVPASLGVPKNDIVQVRADDLRDLGFWTRRGEQSGLQQATELNKTIANLVVNTGSLFYRSDATSGYDFVSEGQALLNERQGYSPMRSFVLNDRDTQAYSQDLAARQTLQGRPADTWATGQIGSNVAEFDVYTGSYLSNLAGGASPGTTATGAQSFVPEAGSVDAVTGTVTNVDHRIASIVVADSSGYNVGDRVSIGAIESVGLADKTSTGTLMTFSVVGKSDGTHIEVFPKPIAWSERPVAAGGDGTLSYSQAAFANVDTAIAGGETVARLNIDASARANIFWAKPSIEILGGNAPLQILGQYDGMQVISKTLKSGQSMYCVYDGNLATLNLRMRVFAWYGAVNLDPAANGVGVRF